VAKKLDGKHESIAPAKKRTSCSTVWVRKSTLVALQKLRRRRRCRSIDQLINKLMEVQG